MAVALVVLAGALVLAYSSTRRANRNEGVATSNEAKAKASEIEAKKSEKRAKEKEKLAIENEQKAKAQARIANLRRLAALSGSERNRHFDLSLLLAVETLTSLKKEKAVESHDDLYQGLQARPGLTSFLHINEGAVASVAFSPDRKSLAVGYGVGTGGVVLWDVAGRPPHLPPGRDRGLGQQRGLQPRRRDPRRRIRRHRRRPLGRRCGAVEHGGSAAPGHGPLAVTEGCVTSVALAPTARPSPPDTASASVACRRCGAVGCGARKRLADDPLRVGEGYVPSVAFSPDGKTLAAGYGVVSVGAGGVVLWDVAVGSAWDGPLPVTEGFVTSVAFSPDGKTLAAGYGGGGGVGGVVLWDVAAASAWRRPPPVNEGSFRAWPSAPTARPSPPDTAAAAAAAV